MILVFSKFPVEAATDMKNMWIVADAVDSEDLVEKAITVRPNQFSHSLY